MATKSRAEHHRATRIATRTVTATVRKWGYYRFLAPQTPLMRRTGMNGANTLIKFRRDATRLRYRPGAPVVDTTGREAEDRHQVAAEDTLRTCSPLSLGKRIVFL